MKGLDELLVVLRCSLPYLAAAALFGGSRPLRSMPPRCSLAVLSPARPGDGPQRCWGTVDRRRRAPCVQSGVRGRDKGCRNASRRGGRPPPASIGAAKSICVVRQAAYRPLPIGKSGISGGWTKVWCALSSTQRRLRTHCGLLTTAIDA